MFSNTAYEALYRYLGLVFHAGSIQLITSEPFFKGLILVIFGGLFLLTSWQFVSRHLLGHLVQRHNVPLSKFIKLTFCLVLGISILKVSGRIDVEDFGNQSWAQNSYVKDRVSNLEGSYEVSFVFDLLSRSAEEIGKYLTYAGDYIFGRGKDSYLKSPYAYAKAIMLAGAATIDDDKLRTMTSAYTHKCLQRILPDVIDDNSDGKLNKMFRTDAAIDNLLSKIQLSEDGGLVYTCRDFKVELTDALDKYAIQKYGKPPEGAIPSEQSKIAMNVNVSSMLLNHFRNERETVWGIQRGSSVPGATGTVYQYLGKLFSWDAFVSIFTFGHGSNTHGASEAASRAKDFSELLTRAPHLKGIVMMILIGIFPWLIFPVVYGKWQILTWWFWIYLSVCLWTPIWAILYHVMQNIAFTGETLNHLGELSDGVSIYSAQVVLDRIYYLYSVFAMAQLMVPAITTGLAIYFLRPMLSGASAEEKPEFIDGATSAGSTVVGVASGMPEIGALNAAK